MIHSLRLRAWLSAIVAVMPSVLFAQQQSAARPADAPVAGPPIRKIATASALSSENLGAINGVVELKDGRVLVNDGTRRRLLAMDTTLTKVDLVLDSLAEIANTYGTRPGMLIPYRGDSTLFVDPASFAVLVLDPMGRVARVRSVWRVQESYLYSQPSGTYGWPATDAKGRIVYRMPAQAAPPKVAPPAGVPYFPPDPDSAFIVAIDLDTRKLDTLGTIRIPKQIMSIKQTAEGFFSLTITINPLPSTDEWAVMPDGTVAFVRGRDYRIEFLHGDGTMTSSSKLPFDWQHLADDDKQKLVDSVKSANQKTIMTGFVGTMIRWANQYNRPYPATFKVPDGYSPPPGLMKDWKFPAELKFPANYIYGCPPGVEPTTTAAPVALSGAPAPAPTPTPAGLPAGPPGAITGTPSCIPSPVMVSGGNAPPAPTPRDVNVMPAAELPDYRPPLAGNSARADADGNLWIHTIPAKPVPGGLIYDVVNPQGELFDRLQLPPGYTLVGFGKGKVVYLSMRDMRGIHLARVRLK